jgi:PAS domain S-box-containing protein
LAEKERARAVQSFRGLIKNVRNEEYVFQAKNGREFVGELSSSPVCQPSGEILFFVSTIKDITECKQKEQALRESEERFKQVAENAEEWIWEIDADGMYTYSSPIVERILGYKPEEIVGKKHFFDLFIPESREQLREAAFAAFERKQPFHGFLNKNVHKSGEEVWLSTSGVPMVDAQGVLVGYRGTDTDITEVKKADEALRTSEAKYRELINGMNDTAWVIDSDAKFVDVNEAAVRMLGYSRAELLSMGPADIDSSLSSEEISKLVRNMPADQTQVFETSHTTKDGKKIPVEISSSLVTYQGRQAVLSIARNITDRVEMRRKIEEYALNLERKVEERTSQLKVANEQLLKSQRLAAIGELAGMVGHDLRNPLTGIKNAAYFLRKKGTAISEAQSKNMIDTIDKCVENSNRIINDLLDYAREIRLELQNVSPCQLITEALAMVEIPGRIKILSTVPESPHIQVEPDKIKRVFVNILKNAVDAMPEDGVLTIEFKRSDDCVEFSFADTGCGIPREILPNLFSPLFTTKAAGMGFGLAICKRFVDAHQGTITVETAQGKGTTFKITLPIEKNDLAPTKKAVIHRRIIAVDDGEGSTEALSAHQNSTIEFSVFPNMDCCFL